MSYHISGLIGEINFQLEYDALDIAQLMLDGFFRHLKRTSSRWVLTVDAPQTTDQPELTGDVFQRLQADVPNLVDGFADLCVPIIELEIESALDKIALSMLDRREVIAAALKVET